MTGSLDGSLKDNTVPIVARGSGLGPFMMWPVMAYLGIGAVRADAVFASGLQRRDEPSASQVRQAAAAAIRAFGWSGCAGRVAQEFGDHPETAAIRMRWARGVASAAFADWPPEPAHVREVMMAVGRAADGMIVSARRLLAYIRAGDSEGAALEMDRHLRGLLYVWRLALPGSQMIAGEVVT